MARGEAPRATRTPISGRRRRDEVRHHPVDPYRGEREGETREQGEQRRVEALRREGGRHDFFQARARREAGTPRSTPQMRAAARRPPRRSTLVVRTTRVMARSPVAAWRKVDHGTGRFGLEAPVERVAREADDGDPRTRGEVAQAEAASDRILPGPQPAGHRLVDDGDGGRRRCRARSKSRPRRRGMRSVSKYGPATARMSTSGAWPRSSAVPSGATRFAVLGPKKGALLTRAARSTPGQRAHAVQDGRVEARGGAAIRVGAVTGRDRHRDDARRIESRDRRPAGGSGCGGGAPSPWSRRRPARSPRPRSPNAGGPIRAPTMPRPSLSARAMASTREDWRAGTRPKRAAAASAARPAKARAWRSSWISSRRGRASGAAARRASMIPLARRRPRCAAGGGDHERSPSAAARPAGRVPRPGPSGSRSPARRAAARTSTRWATFAQAISITSATTASRMKSARRRSEPTIASWTVRTVTDQPPFVSRVRGLQAGGHRLQLGARRRDAGARPDAREHAEVTPRAVVARAQLQGRPGLGSAAGNGEARRHDARDRVRLAVEGERAAERARDRRRTSAARARPRSRSRADRRRRPKARPSLGGTPSSPNVPAVTGETRICAGSPRARPRHRPRALEGGHGLQAAALRRPVQRVRRGHPELRQAPLRMRRPHAQQASGVGVGQRAATRRRRRR